MPQLQAWSMLQRSTRFSESVFALGSWHVLSSLMKKGLWKEAGLVSGQLLIKRSEVTVNCWPSWILVACWVFQSCLQFLLGSSFHVCFCSTMEPWPSLDMFWVRASPFLPLVITWRQCPYLHTIYSRTLSSCLLFCPGELGLATLRVLYCPHQILGKSKSSASISYSLSPYSTPPGFHFFLYSRQPCFWPVFSNWFRPLCRLGQGVHFNPGRMCYILSWLILLGIALAPFSPSLLVISKELLPFSDSPFSFFLNFVAIYYFW